MCGPQAPLGGSLLPPQGNPRVLALETSNNPDSSGQGLLCLEPSATPPAMSDGRGARDGRLLSPTPCLISLSPPWPRSAPTLQMETRVAQWPPEPAVESKLVRLWAWPALLLRSPPTPIQDTLPPPHHAVSYHPNPVTQLTHLSLAAEDTRVQCLCHCTHFTVTDLHTLPRTLRAAPVPTRSCCTPFLPPLFPTALAHPSPLPVLRPPASQIHSPRRRTGQAGTLPRARLETPGLTQEAIGAET